MYRPAAIVPAGVVLALATGLVVACSDDAQQPAPTIDGGGGDGGGGGGVDSGNVDSGRKSNAAGCTTMCTSSGYSAGTETDLKNGLIECMCDGAGGEVTKASCEQYCAAFSITKTSLGNDGTAKPLKCLCDGR